MTTRTLTLTATNSAGSVSANAAVTVADPPGGGNIVELVGVNLMKDVDPDPTRAAVYTGVMGQRGALADSGMAYSPYWGVNGALIVDGSAHADYGGNEQYAFSLDSELWTRLNEPSTAMPSLATAQANDRAGIAINNTDPATWVPPVDLLHGELSDGTPMGSHTYSSRVVIPGGTKGLLIGWGKLALSWRGDRNCAWTHATDLDTGVRFRYSLNAAPATAAWSGNMPADVVCYDAARKRIWAIRRGNSNSLSFLDTDTRLHSAPMPAYVDAGFIPTCPRTPVDDHIIYVCCSYSGAGQNVPFRMGAVNLGNTSANSFFLKLVGDIPPPTYWAAYGFDWDTIHDRGYIYRGNAGSGSDIYNDPTTIWQLDKPASGDFHDWWTLTKITTPTAFPRMLNGVYARWRWCENNGKFALMSNTQNKVAFWTPPS